MGGDTLDVASIVLDVSVERGIRIGTVIVIPEGQNVVGAGLNRDAVLTSQQIILLVSVRGGDGILTAMSDSVADGGGIILAPSGQIAGLEIAVDDIAVVRRLDSGLITDNGGSANLLGELNDIPFHIVEIALIVTGQSKGIHAGSGIVLNLESDDSELLSGVIFLGDSVAEVNHERIDLGVQNGSGLGVDLTDLEANQLQSGGVITDSDNSRNQAGVVLQIDGDGNRIARLTLYVGDHDGGLLGSGGESERHRGANQKNRQTNC